MVLAAQAQACDHRHAALAGPARPGKGGAHGPFPYLPILFVAR